MDEKLPHASTDDVTNSGASVEEPDWTLIWPVPDGAPELPEALVRKCGPEDYSLRTLHRYPDSDGRLLGYIARYEKPIPGEKSDKTFRPFTLWKSPTGKSEWQCKGFPKPYPLYGL